MPDEIIVVGGGASGMMAALAAARAGGRVTLLEGQDKCGRKLLLTGNGRCNISSADAQITHRYLSETEGGAVRLAEQVMGQFSPDDTVRFFRDRGLFIRSEGRGLMYPVTGQARSVLAVLQRSLRESGVKVKCSEKVTGLSRSPEGLWNVRTQTWTYTGRAVVLCCGSKAVPSTGSDGSGYALARQAALPLTAVRPALTALRSDAGRLKGADGTRVRGRITLMIGGVEAAQEEGEVQFSGACVSGIAAFQLSRLAVRALENGADVSVSIDLYPEMPEGELAAYLHALAISTGVRAGELLTGLIPDRLIRCVLEAAGLKMEADMADEAGAAAAQLAGAVKRLLLPVRGVRDFENCQVCAGGIALGAVDPESLAMTGHGHEGLFAAGELLDIDGPCGGYNLQWAWSSGYVAGRSAAAYVTDAAGAV